jgi:hypothetical protein
VTDPRRTRWCGLFAGIVLVLGSTTSCSGTDGTSEDEPVTDATTPDDGATSSGPRWQPSVGAPWQWQLSGELDLSVDVPVYDVDWTTTSAATVEELHDQGRKVICYVSVGTWESYRDDAEAFPDEVLGRPLADFPDERWLDIRNLDVVGPIMAARFDICRDKGFDAVEPDNVDGYQNKSGFPLTGEDQLRFNRWIAAAVHDRGMSVGLKNDLGQVRELVGDFDFAVNEQCFEFNECELLLPFIEAGKAVLHVEYKHAVADFCSTTAQLKFSSMRKRFDLDAFREACPGT